MLMLQRNPKNQPKSAAAKPSTNGTASRGGRTRGRGRRGRNAGRPKAKTADELDAEMVDYFDVNAATGATGAETNTNGAAAPVANGDAGMDEISVCFDIQIRSCLANMWNSERYLRRVDGFGCLIVLDCEEGGFLPKGGLRSCKDLQLSCYYPNMYY